MPSYRKGRGVRAALSAIVCLAISSPLVARADYRDDVGFTALRNELGSMLPTGAGTAASQVEAAVQVSGYSTWMPDASNGDFAGKTIINESNAPAGIYSGHATSVGQVFYGTTSGISPDVDLIAAYRAEAWYGSDFLWTGSARQPASSKSRLVNHSWIGSSSSTSSTLRRIDWVIETDDMVHVAGIGNGTGPATSPLLAGAFNVISSGVTSGQHQYGTVAVDGDYRGGRVRPDIVIPAGSTSSAAGRTSSAAALLIQAAHANSGLSTDPRVRSFTNRAGLVVRNAERSEVIRAALMAGADRVTRNSSSGNMGRYRGSSTYRAANGLDTRYGAGQLNVFNSWHIIAAGEQNSAEDGGTLSGSKDRGFDYDPAFGGLNGTNAVATYALPVSTRPQLLTAALVVNVDVRGGTSTAFDGTLAFRDVSLAVINVANPGAPVTISTSQSTNDNTEHAWLVVPANARYALRVARVGSTTFGHDYGLAWQLRPDSDADGAHDGQDNCIYVDNGPIVADAGGNSQRDSDWDGFGNICDADLDNSRGTVNFTDLARFRAAFAKSNAASDLDGSGGTVNYADLAIFRRLFSRAPGPSAYAR